MRRTKTFTENRWYARDGAGEFREFSKPGEATMTIDAQVHDWVTETGNVIVHPGQLGMHTAWHGTAAGDPYSVMCVTLGLTVLYEEMTQA